MLHTRQIHDLDELRASAFPAPYALVQTVEDAQERSEAWWALLAYERGVARTTWVLGFPDSGGARFFVDGDQLSGRWDGEREIFLPEDGPPLDLRGNPLSLAAIEEDEEDEDAEAEARKR